jgi:hypothetical protein
MAVPLIHERLGAGGRNFYSKFLVLSRAAADGGCRLEVPSFW